MKNLKTWIENNKKEFYILVFILLIASLFRLWRIGEYMTFLGDEGRDAIIVRRLLVDFDPILIGPGTSIGNMYLGPIYYYLMAPFLLLANFSPVGPAVFIALLGVATCVFVWFVSREWFGKIAAMIALLLYSISPVVINYSRSSWNPNIMPFFALLTIYSVWKWWQENKYGWIIVTAISMAFVLQSHYLGLLLLPVIGLYWLLSYLKTKKPKTKNQRLLTRRFINNSFIGFALFLLLMSPLLIFDVRHG